MLILPTFDRQPGADTGTSRYSVHGSPVRRWSEHLVPYAGRGPAFEPCRVLALAGDQVGVGVELAPVGVQQDPLVGHELIADQ